MKKLTPYLLSSCLLVFVMSCTLLQNDDVSPRGEKTKNFNVSDFDEVDGGSAIYFTVKEGSSFNVSAIGDGRDIDDLDIRVRNGELKVDYVNRIGRINRFRMDVIIEMPTIKAVDFSGASDAIVENFTGLQELDAKLSGSSKLRIRQEVGKLTADISGASTLYVVDLVDELDVEASGASTVNAFEADASEAFVEASGASTVRVSVSDYLEVDASGASSVFYRGEPEIKEKTSGASKVRQD